MIETITPAGALSGTVTVPGDKSISHRACMLASMARGESRISNLSPCSDVRSTIECMSKLGAVFKNQSGHMTVTSPGMEAFSRPETPLDAGNSGTTARLLAGICAGLPFLSEIRGDASLHKRPMQRIITPLEQMGASIGSSGSALPLTIRGGTLQPAHYSLPVASAQIKSCIMLAALSARGETVIREPRPSRDHTERMFPEFGLQVRAGDSMIWVPGPQTPGPADIQVPGDMSSAAFFIAAALMVPGSRIFMPNVGLNPGRTGMVSILLDMGARITVTGRRIQNNEPAGDLTAFSGTLSGTEISGPLIPGSIDEIPILAVLATQARGETIIRDAGELRHKETDRIAAVATNLQAMRADVEVFSNGLIIPGPQQLKGAVLESFGDHRIAMAFAVAGLAAAGKTVIKNAECTAVSYPGFFNTLKGLVNEQQ